MDNVVECWVVSGTWLELGTRYVKLELGCRCTTIVVSLLGLETQRKGNLANKASRSSSDKSAFVFWSLTLSVTGLTVTGACFFLLGNFVKFYSQYWGEKILIVPQGIISPAASNCFDLVFLIFLSCLWIASKHLPNKSWDAPAKGIGPPQHCRENCTDQRCFQVNFA